MIYVMHIAGTYVHYNILYKISCLYSTSCHNTAIQRCTLHMVGIPHTCKKGYMCTVCTEHNTYIPSLKLVSFSGVSWSLDLRGTDNSLASERSSALALSMSFSLLSRRSAKVRIISALCNVEGGGWW